VAKRSVSPAAANLPDALPGPERTSEVLGTARSGGINLAGAAFNQALRFGITLLIARLLGRRDVGLFYQAFALFTLLQLIGAGGFKHTLTRFVAVHRVDRDQSALRGTVRLGLAISTLVASAVGVVLFLSSSWLARDAFGDPGLEPLLALVALAMPPTVFTDCALSATQGYKTMRPYALVNLFFEPAFRIVLTGALLAAGLGLTGVMVALLVTNWVAAVLAALALRKLMGPATGSPRYDRLRELYSFTAVSWVTTLTNSGLIWADTIMLGLYLRPADVGVYQISARLVLLATIFIQPMTTSFAPRVADLYRRGSLSMLRETYVLITSWIFRLALPSFIVLIVFPRELLEIFGEGFVAGSTVTVVLALGQLVNSATGPCGYMLLMSGRQALQMANSIGALVLNVALNVWLIPQYGIVGAATSWAITIAGFNLLRLAQVNKLMGMLPVDRGLLKGIAAGVPAIASAVVASALLDGLAALVAGTAAVGCTYVIAIMALGLEEDDRLVVKTLGRRLRPGRG
jgi:O-antigen/teichoic acid export membrane protein